jgi:hypothetical protein
MPKHKEKKQEKKIVGTVVKVTDENIDDVAKAIVEKIRKAKEPKGNSASGTAGAAGRRGEDR